ncbi:co-regulatory protein PtrA N-terminal domain-containing protein [Pseudomonas sp. NA-150]|uniref:co-regulatory protein PtrA N-terminal domain-containing protein n=1 Tax=Pseudomonas sp. NA-150 TaxID=3367525 RepID=UPI0037C5988D
MKSLKALLMVVLMGASVAAMAEGGGDRVMANMIAARDASMAHYQQTEQAEAVAKAHQKDNHDKTIASTQKHGSDELERSN